MVWSGAREWEMVIGGEEVGWLGGLRVGLGTNREEGKEG